MPSTHKTKVHTEKHSFPKETQEAASPRTKQEPSPDPPRAVHFDFSSEINFHLICPSFRNSTLRSLEEGCKCLIREGGSHPNTVDVFDWGGNVHTPFCVYQHFTNENKKKYNKKVGVPRPTPSRSHQQRDGSVPFPHNVCVSHPSEPPPVTLLP